MQLLKWTPSFILILLGLRVTGGMGSDAPGLENSRGTTATMGHSSGTPPPEEASGLPSADILRTSSKDQSTPNPSPNSSSLLVFTINSTKKAEGVARDEKVALTTSSPVIIASEVTEPLLVNNGSEAAQMINKTVLARVKDNSTETEESGSCVNLDVRVCLRQSCKWHSAECVEDVNRVKSEPPFPKSLPKNGEEAVELLKIMWADQPINNHTATICLPVNGWFACILIAILFGLVVTVVLITLVVNFTVKYSWEFCFNRRRPQKNKTSKRGRRVILILPEGQRIPADDYVIDLSSDQPRSKRLGRGDHRFTTFRTSGSPNPLDFPPPVPLDDVAKDCDFDFNLLPPPAPWLYNGDEEDDSASSIVTATVCRKFQCSAPTHSAMVKGTPCSEMDWMSRNNYLASSFTSSQDGVATVQVHMLPSGGPTCPPTPNDITVEDGSYSIMLSDEEEEVEIPPTQVTVLDETALPSASSKAIIVGEERKSQLGSEKSQAEIGSETGNGIANAKVTPNFLKKLKKIAPPVPPELTMLQDTPKGIKSQETYLQLKSGDEQVEESEL